ncbi:hypothetical protein EIP86_009399 [Pleurotus ostreatoroseus]|nr:hypothetical protein EIP86_009399 [Pleurotus ostreatoroseus]
MGIWLSNIGWLVSGCLTLVAMVTSFWLMGKHLQWYTNKAEQRYIVRILLMVPLYAVVSLASYLFWNHSTPLLLLRDCYESTVLTSFFYLLLLYLSPDPEEQKDTFRKFGLSRENDRALRRLGQDRKKWMFPLGFIHWKPQDGFYFLQLMKWGVLQYCVIRPTSTLAAVILDYIGLYCEDSWSPGWGHLYITVIMSISVTIAMYCLLQLYMPVSHLLKPQKPLLKLIAIKAVVFLTFWQASGLSLLTMFNVVKDMPYMTVDNINIGIGAILETFEMMVFAFVHIKAFTYKPYYDPPNRTLRLRSLVHAFNFKETIDELWVGIKYMWYRYKGRETDVQARRHAVLEGVFGHSRIPTAKQSAQPPTRDVEPEKERLTVAVSVEETVHIGQERQWLGVGNDYGYGLGWHSRHQQEKSGGLGEQIERELTSRGYPLQDYTPLGTADPDHGEQEPLNRKRNSWWRNVYARLSHSDRPEGPINQPAAEDLERGRSQHRQQREFRRMTGRKLSQIEAQNETYDDPPPPSVIRSYRESKSRKTSTVITDSSPFSPTQGFSLPVETPCTPVSPMSVAESSDSFLARAFSPGTDASRSTVALTGGATSTQSHRSRVHLSAAPSLIPKNVASHSPVITRQPHPVPKHTSRRHAVELTRTPERAAAIDLSEDLPLRQTRSHRRDSAIHGGSPRHHTARPRLDHRAHHNPGHTAAQRDVSMSKPPRLRRDQIVLPAPLAPSAQLPLSNATHPDYRSSLGSLSPSTPPLPRRDHLDTRLSPLQLTPPPHRFSSPEAGIADVDAFGDPSADHAPPLRRNGATRHKGRRYTDTSLQKPFRR